LTQVFGLDQCLGKIHRDCITGWAERQKRGEILAVGNGSTNDKGDTRPMSVKVGDNVLFGKYAGTEVEVDGEELLVMSEGDIIAVVE